MRREIEQSFFARGDFNRPAQLKAAPWAALACAAAMSLAGAAYAQNYGQDLPASDPFSDFVATDAIDTQTTTPGYEPAPGYQRPDFETDPASREEKDITVFEQPPSSNEPDSLNQPINVFAGQRQKYDPGVVGGLLGRAKDSALGR